MDEEARPELLILKPHHHIPVLLLDPPIVRVVRRRTEKHLTRADMDEREGIRNPNSNAQPDEPATPRPDVPKLRTVSALVMVRSPAQVSDEMW
ncbi:MAG: hypothetical protein ACYTFA_14100 [Planctomycetota bacterium]